MDIDWSYFTPGEEDYGNSAGLHTQPCSKKASSQLSQSTQVVLLSGRLFHLLLQGRCNRVVVSSVAMRAICMPLNQLFLKRLLLSSLRAEKRCQLPSSKGEGIQLSSSLLFGPYRRR